MNPDIVDRLKTGLLKTTDTIMAQMPEPRPPLEKLKSCRLIAHRGEHGGNHKLENTIESFDAAVAAGAWGIEFDVRFTSDSVPIVHHDKSAQRSFGLNVQIEDLAFRELRKTLPAVPTCDEVIARFKDKTHLMIEIKRTKSGFTRTQLEAFKRSLSPLNPTHNFHLLGLSEDLLLICDFVPREACVAVAEFNVPTLSKKALFAGFGGFTGHYLMLNQKCIHMHQSAGQKTGTGFASSRSVLRRELNRGVDWIFTNHTSQLSALLMEEIKGASEA